MRAVYIVNEVKVAKILVDPMRRAILDLLRQRPMTQAGLANELGLTGASLNHHMKILRSRKLVTVFKREVERHRIMQIFLSSGAYLFVYEDYYAGYYWSNDPYESYDLPGRKNDIEIKSGILERLRLNCGGIKLDSIVISVDNGIVILTGHVKTYRDRRLVGQEVWRTCGVAKVLNELQVTEPETAGPSKILEEAHL